MEVRKEHGKGVEVHQACRDQKKLPYRFVKAHLEIYYKSPNCRED